MEPWVIDTDGGVDDAQALIIALRHQATFNLLGITVVAGNVPLPLATKNVAECLRVCQREDVPYYIGADRPFVSQANGAEFFHGVDGLHGYWEKKHGANVPVLKDPESLTAALAIVKMAGECERLNLLTLGPLTNLALAILLDPTLPSKLNRVVVMGGAVHGSGNVTSCAEYNIYSDPEAAYVAFERLPLIELVSWECTDYSVHKFDTDFLDRYTGAQTLYGEFVKIVTCHREDEFLETFCDPLAACVALDPSIIQESYLRHGAIELGGCHTRGMVVVNWEKSDIDSTNSSPRQNVLIIERLDMEKVRQMFLASVA